MRELGKFPLGVYPLAGEAEEGPPPPDDPIVVEVPVGSILIYGQPPAQILTPFSVNVPVASVTITGLAPTASVTDLVFVPTGSLTFSGLAPTFATSANIRVPVPKGTLTLTGLAPTIAVSANALVKPGIDTVVITGLVPLVSITAPPAGEIFVTGFRWRADDDDEADATWLAADDTNYSEYIGDAATNARLRLLLKEDSGVSGVRNDDFTPTLEFVENGRLNAIRTILASSSSIPDDFSSAVSALATSVSISPDGRHMFVLESSTNYVWQFVLDIPWIPASGRPTGARLYVGGQEGTSRGLHVSNDGLYLYITGGANDRVNQYTLTSAWNLNGASYASLFKSVGSQQNNPTGVRFKPDRSRMYICGTQNSRLHSYTLSSPNDVSTASYDTKLLTVSSQDLTPHDLFFNPDGTILYVLGQTTDTIYQYTLSTPWDISTGTYASKSFSVSSAVATPGGMHLDATGTRLYVVGNSSSAYYELATPWDISTALHTAGTLSVSGQDTSGQGIDFSPDGMHLYMVGDTNDRVYQYNLTRPWVVGTGSFFGYISVSSQDGNPSGVRFRPDGLKMYIVGFANDNVRQYSLSTAWDITTATFDSVSLSVSGQDGTPTDLAFSLDGTKLFVSGSGNDRVYSYTLSTPWDLSTASYDSVYLAVGSQDTTPSSIAFDSTGKHLFVIGTANDKIWHYVLTTAYSLATATLFSASRDSSVTADTTPNGLYVAPDAAKLFIVGAGSDLVRSYYLNAPWQAVQEDALGVVPFNSSNLTNGADTTQQLGAGSFQTPNAGVSEDGVAGPVDIAEDEETEVEFAITVGDDLLRKPNFANGFKNVTSYAVTTQTTTPIATWFRSNGMSMYVLSSTGTIYEYSLSSAFDVTTASYASRSFSVTTQAAGARSFFLSSAGTKLFVLDFTTSKIYQYTLSTAYEINSASYDTVSLTVSALTEIYDLHFKSDGLSLFVVGISTVDSTATDTIVKYTLSSAWDMTTPPSLAQTRALRPLSIQFSGFSIASDGLTAYANDNSLAFEMSMSSAFDLSTLLMAPGVLSLGTLSNTTNGASFIGPSDDQLFLTTTTGSKVYSYRLSYDQEHAQYAFRIRESENNYFDREMTPLFFSVGIGAVAQPGVGSMLIGGLAPLVSFPYVPLGTLTFTGYPPLMPDPQLFNVPTGEISINGFAPSLGWTIRAPFEIRYSLEFSASHDIVYSLNAEIEVAHDILYDILEKEVVQAEHEISYSMPVSARHEIVYAMKEVVSASHEIVYGEVTEVVAEHEVVYDLLEINPVEIRHRMLYSLLDSTVLVVGGEIKVIIE